MHHIKPWEHGGKTNINNLVLLCPTCHTQTHKPTTTHPMDPKTHLQQRPPQPLTNQPTPRTHPKHPTPTP
ncbi:HNH endonuclease [Candidatus Poriferisocius sp.]|uniref:HNH endonuclease n=1 Tax=Candidatus Poriferisocius sp. TaxID=3101276 RepID=UPI003B01E0F6